jgi:hypothetical protein
MRFGTKMMLWAFCAAPTAAAMVLTGAGAANAAVTAPATPSGPTYNPWGPGPHCNWWARERWNVNGDNTVKLVYLSNTYTYTVDFKQNGSCLGGKLTDTYLPSLPPGSRNLEISGTVDDNHIKFSVTYPPGVQGATPGTLGVCGVPGCCRYRAPFRSLSLVAWCRRGSAGMVLALVSRRGRRAVPRSAAPAGGAVPHSWRPESGAEG